MNNEDKLNFDLYKAESENYRKLTKKIVIALPTGVLTKELKRRGIIKWDYLEDEWIKK